MAERLTEDELAKVTAVVDRPGMASSIKPGADASAEARAQRRSIRERLNDEATRKLAIGCLVTLVGGSFWGFSGTAASYLFDNYQVDTLWLMSVRQIISGLLFMITAFAFDRKRLIEMWRTPHHRRELLLFSAFGMMGNQLFYLLAVRLTNAGTATVMQCLQLVIIMAVTCLRVHRKPRRRELVGLCLALCGTFFIATGGDPTRLAIPAEGLAVGLLCAAGASCISLIPVHILPAYGSTVVTGSSMFTCGVVSCAFVQPWAHVPALGADGWIALAVLVVIGSFLAFLLYMQGVKEIGGMRASLLGTVEPISATITSAVVLGTLFAPTDLLGFGLIIAMVFLTV